VLSKKADFLIVGAQKCGTTALAHFLRGHPEIYLAGAKADDQRSLHYFDRDFHFQDGEPDYAAYHRLFDPREGARVIGESTPAYIYWDAAPSRIWRYNPGIKLIAVLRNPITRAFSNWNMERQRGNEPLDFYTACMEERKRAFQTLPLQDLVNAYTARGFYSHQVRRLQQYFPDEQLLFIKYEEFQKAQLETINATCTFLGVSPASELLQEDVHKRPYDREISQRELELLRWTFEKDIEALERLLDWDCSDWLD
jgi:hypothetical protein